MTAEQSSTSNAAAAATNLVLFLVVLAAAERERPGDAQDTVRLIPDEAAAALVNVKRYETT